MTPDEFRACVVVAAEALGATIDAAHAEDDGGYSVYFWGAARGPCNEALRFATLAVDAGGGVETGQIDRPAQQYEYRQLDPTPAAVRAAVGDALAFVRGTA